MASRGACGIFVDAGYLIAEGAKACVVPSAKRGDVAVDYERLVARLCERATKACGLPVLRVYWYDGAIDGVPTTDQHSIGALPDVKLRLGRLSGGRQKGVDALVYRDLSVLARERAVVTAFLVAGDEDLREGVASAQEQGVHVTLWGVGSAPGSQLALSLLPQPVGATSPLGGPSIAENRQVVRSGLGHSCGARGHRGSFVNAPTYPGGTGC